MYVSENRAGTFYSTFLKKCFSTVPLPNTIAFNRLFIFCLYFPMAGYTPQEQILTVIWEGEIERPGLLKQHYLIPFLK